MNPLAQYAEGLERQARLRGLDYYPVDFELAPQSLMTEIAVYGLPVRMPHWSFGVRYIHQLVRQSMGNSKIFEVMFPGDPCRAFLMDSNSLAENTLVTAHVLGHADFAKNNQLFARFHEMSGGNIVEQAAAHAHRIQRAINEVGVERVEAVLDAALALESHVDVTGELHRSRYPEFVAERQRIKKSEFQQRFAALPGESEPQQAPAGQLRTAIPPHPEYDLLWFIATLRARPRAVGARHLPHGARRVAVLLPGVRLPDHERGLGFVLARAPAARGRLPAAADLPRGAQGALRRGAAVRLGRGDRARRQPLPPRLHHLGAHRRASTASTSALEVRREEDDFGFIRNWLDRELAEESGLLVYEEGADGEIRVASRDLAAVREAILAPKFNYGAPRVAATGVAADGSLDLAHDYAADGRGLDAARARAGAGLHAAGLAPRRPPADHGRAPATRSNCR